MDNGNDVKKAVSKFLTSAKNYINFELYSFTIKSSKELMHEGISYKEALHIIQKLTYKNLIALPSIGHKNKAEIIYEFGYRVAWLGEMYIKLTLNKSFGLLVMSFHSSNKKCVFLFQG